MGRNSTALTGLFLILLLPVMAQDFNLFELKDGWKFRRAGTKEWMPARVPGVVHLDLMRNNQIPDPFMLDNEAKVQWVGETGWEYVKTFNYEESLS